MNRKPKKILTVSLIVVGVLVGAAVLLGVLNALIGKGSWNIGWVSYRYDDSAYQIGDGTVPATDIERITLDWIDGKVKIELCDDMFLSMSESAATALGEDTQLRWCISEDGTALSIKYRKSSSFFASFGNSEKILILRIPKRMFPQLQSLEVTSESAPITLIGMEAEAISVKSVSGDLTLVDCRTTRLTLETVSGHSTCRGLTAEKTVLSTVSGAVSLSYAATPTQADIESTSGEVAIALPGKGDFSLHRTTTSGRFICDFPGKEENGTYICGNPTATLRVKTVSGDLKLLTSEN